MYSANRNPGDPKSQLNPLKFLLFMGVLLVSVSGSVAHPKARSLTRGQIREAERQLSDRGYWTGAVDGQFDDASRQALIAFQKWEGR